MVSVSPRMPSLKVLYITLHAQPNDQPWALSPEFFFNISQMQHLNHSNIRINTTSVQDINEELVYTSITGVDLINLSRLPLTILGIQPNRTRANYLLEPREVIGSDILTPHMRLRSGSHFKGFDNFEARDFPDAPQNNDGHF